MHFKLLIRTLDFKSVMKNSNKSTQTFHLLSKLSKLKFLLKIKNTIEFLVFYSKYKSNGFI